MRQSSIIGSITFGLGIIDSIVTVMTPIRAIRIKLSSQRDRYRNIRLGLWNIRFGLWNIRSGLWNIRFGL